MADAIPIKSRLLPSLLDRLTDEEPRNPVESLARQVLQEEAFLGNIRRDLQWLFNAVSLEAAVDLDGFDFRDEFNRPRNYLKESVLNFGIQDLSGHTASSVKAAHLENRLRLAVAHFEPRLLPGSVKVDVQAREAFNHNALSFDLHGDLWMQPSPWPQHWKTDVDLETGAVRVEPLKPKR